MKKRRFTIVYHGKRGGRHEMHVDGMQFGGVGDKLLGYVRHSWGNDWRGVDIYAIDTISETGRGVVFCARDYTFARYPHGVIIARDLRENAGYIIH